MITEAVAFLVMLNPFGLFLYLQPVMKELSHKDFIRLVIKANVLSYIIYLLFLAVGDLIFEYLLQIQFDSFRIFGGIVIFSFAYLFIVRGQRAFITMKEDITGMATEVALPFMVGAGTISLTILIAHQFAFHVGAVALAMIIAVNFIILMLLKDIRQGFEHRKRRLEFDKKMEIMFRLNAFFLGAIGTNMVVVGLKNLFF